MRREKFSGHSPEIIGSGLPPTSTLSAPAKSLWAGVFFLVGKKANLLDLGEMGRGGGGVGVDLGGRRCKATTADAMAGCQRRGSGSVCGMVSGEVDLEDGPAARGQSGPVVSIPE